MFIRKWRKKSKTTQEQLAELVGSSKSYVSQIESGIRRPSPELAKRIEAVTNGEVTAAELLGLVPTPTRGLSETPARFDPASQTISITLEANDIEDARELGVDIETVAREAASAAVKAKLAAEFKRQSAAGIAASNAWMAEHGTLAEQSGMIEDDDGAV